MEHLLDGHGVAAATRHQVALSVSVGLPPARPDLAGVGVRNRDGVPLASQVDVLDRHGDGSARTVLVRFVPQAPEPYALAWIVPPPAAAPPPLFDPQRRVIDNGRMRLELTGGGGRGIVIDPYAAAPEPRRPWHLYTEVELASGERRSSQGLEGTLTVEANGPVWCSVRISGAYGLTPLNYELRLQAAAGVPMVHWQYRLVNMSEDETRIRAAGCCCAQVGVSSDISLLCQAENQAVCRQVGGERVLEGAVPAYLVTEAQGLPLAWGIVGMRQLYPKALFARADLLGWSALPAGVPAEALRFVRHGLRRGFWFEPDGTMRMPPCFSWRTDGFLAWGPDAAGLAQVAAEPPVIPPVILPGNSLGELLDAGAARQEPVRGEAARLVSSYLKTQHEQRLFGLFDYGDLMTADPQQAGEHDPVWLNGEHDGAYGPLLFYSVTGDPLHFTVGQAIARHQMDIDTRRRGEAWTLAKHAVGHVSDRCENGHLWLEGLALYYRLTGDPDALEVVARMCDWLAQDVAATVPGDFPTVREAGVSLWMLSVGYEVFPDRHYLLGIMEPHAQAMLDLQHEDGSWDPYIKADWPLHRHPRYRKTLHLYNLAMGLMRYAQVSKDPRVAPALHRFLRHALVDGDLLLPGGRALFYENAFAIERDEPLSPADRRRLREAADVSAAADGVARQEGYPGWGTRRPRGSRPAAVRLPEPWDTALFPLLEVMAWVDRTCPDAELVDKGWELLDDYFRRHAGASLQHTGSFRAWTPLLQHLLPFLARCGRRSGAATTP